MKKKENLTENVRVRLTREQKEILNSIARKENISSSDVIRRKLFEEKSSSSYSIMIQHNLIKNEFINRIQFTKIPETTKKKLIKEVGTIGQCIL